MRKVVRVFPKAIALGTIAVALSMIFKILVFDITLENLREFWAISFIHFGTTGIVAEILEYAEAVLYTTASVGVIGLILLAKGRGDQSFGDKAFGKIPLLKTVWGFIRTISNLVHHITERPFVFIAGWPSEGHSMIGVITKRQAFSQDGTTIFYRPSVYVFTPPNPTSGFLDFPEKNKLTLLVSPASQIMQLIVSIGILGPEFIELVPHSDQSLLDYYYAEESRTSEDQNKSV